MEQDIPIQIYNKEGQDVIKLDDLIVFLSHRKEQTELKYDSIQADNRSNLIKKSQISGELSLIKELLNKPEHIFTMFKKEV